LVDARVFTATQSLESYWKKDEEITG